MDPTFGIVNLIITLIFFVALIFFLKRKPQELSIEVLNDKWQGWKWQLKSVLLGHKDFKTQFKEFKKQIKELEKQGCEKVLFFLEFEGDLRASEVDQLRQEITAVLQAARPGEDEVFIRLTSAGGVVQDYGLGASQLRRLKDKNISVVVGVDVMAASGGYLMACVADKILAAPFAVVGSIGVIAQVPNFHRLLKRWDIDYREYTAGEFKRTVSLFGEITPKGEQKFLEQLESTHQFFKDFVQAHRPQINISELSTGEFWYGKKALDLGLIDEIKTSDEYLLEKMAQGYQVVKVKYLPRRPWGYKMAEGLVNLLEKKFWRILSGRF